MRAKAYQIMLRVPGAEDSQAVDDVAVEFAQRIGAELGARLVTVCELDPTSGETVPIFAGTPS